MIDSELLQQVGELRGRVATAEAERVAMHSKITEMLSLLSRVDVINANLENMRHDYHERFGKLQVDYGLFLAALKTVEGRLSSIETDDRIALATAKKGVEIRNMAVGAVWVIIVSMVGGLATLFVQWWEKK